MEIPQELWQKLISGDINYLGQAPERPVIFPGSFDPVHAGHRAMAKWAEQLLGCSVHPEISVANVDKPTLSLHELRKRIADARTMGHVLVTRAAKFVQKVELFPNATFVIGADTAIRLDAIRYYDDSHELRDTQLQAINDHGVRFLVFGRLIDQRFCNAEELHLSPILRELCQFVPASDFREDICSTELREG